jgi:hypothetical protein
MKPITVYLDFRQLERGIWCNTCLLPSGQAFEVTVLRTDGVGQPRRFSGCPDCGNPTSHETPPAQP